MLSLKSPMFAQLLQKSQFKIPKKNANNFEITRKFYFEYCGK